MGFSNIAQSGYDDLAKIGKIKAMLNFACSIFLCIIMSALIIYYIYYTWYYTTISGNVIQVQSCSSHTVRTGTVNNRPTYSTYYLCDIRVSYIYNGVTYESNKQIDSTTNYQLNDLVYLSIDTKNPSDCTITYEYASYVPYILCCVLILCCILATIQTYLITFTKVGRAVYGADTIYHMM